MQSIVVDIGNTHIHWGIFTDNTIIVQRSFAHRMQQRGLLEALRDHFAAYFEHPKPDIDINATHAPIIPIIGSVVPSVTPMVAQALSHFISHQPLIATTALHTGVKVNAVNTHEIGIDLVANAALARARNPHRCSIVVDVGTAISFTALDSSATIRGVAIAPGIETAMRALASHAALIPPTQLEIPSHYLGSTTVEALGIGVGLGSCGLIETVARGMREELGTEASVFLTGGGAPSLLSTLRCVDHYIPTLTLEGLNLILQLNTP